MKSRYDNSPSKDASMQNARQKRMQAEHNANDAFVKRKQAELSRMAGKEPNLSEASMHMNAYMCNNGEHAQEFGRKLTEALDKVAFPVK